eukprot:scaffold637757_cov48-Prasinocladus_malaysianus.AAC.1
MIERQVFTSYYSETGNVYDRRMKTIPGNLQWDIGHTTSPLKLANTGKRKEPAALSSVVSSYDNTAKSGSEL